MESQLIRDIYIILLSPFYHSWGKNNAIRIANNRIKKKKEQLNDIDT